MTSWQKTHAHKASLLIFAVANRNGFFYLLRCQKGKVNFQCKLLRNFI